jgi:DNA-binding winged helix-turn-helix (wHTH) protein
MATTAASAETGPPDTIRIRLAREPDFDVGPLTLVPSRRVVRRSDGSEEVVEPRVMQVLVALFRAGGAIVGRDDLVAACWDGRIVGDDAINRVISRVRRVQETVGRDVFELETVTRVGYRIRRIAAPEEPAATAIEPAASEHPASSAAWMLGRTSRRAVVRGAVAVATAAGVPALLSVGERTRWLGLAGHRPNAAARRLYEEGMRIQYHALIATSEQAESYFRQATEADPEWPDAWGELAMTYRHLLDGETNTAQWRHVERARSAAKRALELDPDNAQALTALALIRSPYRRWREAEAEYRALLRRSPRMFVLRGHLGRVLRDVGRFSAALEMTAITAREQPFVLLPALFHAQTLWGLGRVREAEAAFKGVIERWPKHVVAWDGYTHFLAHSGRAGAAAVFASDREARPAGVPDRVLDRRMLEARALATRERADIDTALDAMREIETRKPGGSHAALPVGQLLPFRVAIGDLDTAFALLDGVYFGSGRFAAPGSPPTGPLTRRNSDFLFMPWAAPLRRDARFAPLLRGIGLTDHWRETGTRPDIAG